MRRFINAIITLKLSKSYLISALYAATFSLYIELPDSIKISHLIFPIAAIILTLILLGKHTFVKRRLLSLNTFSFYIFVFLLAKLLLTNQIFFRTDFFNILIAILFSLTLSMVKDNDLEFLLNSTIYLSLCVIFFETYYRITNPMIGSSLADANALTLNGNLHAFKINSLMYSTSNGTAYHLLILLSMVLFTYKYRIDLKYKVTLQLVISALILMTFSRTAYLAVILLYLFYFARFFKKRQIILLITFASPIALSCLLAISSNIGTFGTKLDIFINIKRYLSNATFFDILFGNNFTPPKFAYHFFQGYVGHTHYFDLIYFLGFIGAACYLLVFIFPYLKLGALGSILVFLFIFIGFSNIRIFSHVMLLSFAITYRLSLVDKRRLH